MISGLSGCKETKIPVGANIHIEIIQIDNDYYYQVDDGTKIYLFKKTKEE